MNTIERFYRIGIETIDISHETPTPTVKVDIEKEILKLNVIKRYDYEDFSFERVTIWDLVYTIVKNLIVL